MSSIVAITSGSAAASLLLAVLFWSTAKLEGWRHYRFYAAVALLSSAYSLNSLPHSVVSSSPGLNEWTGRLNLVIALSTPVVWALFDAGREKRRFRRYEQVIAAILLTGAALALVPGLMTGKLHWIDGSWFGGGYTVPTTTPLANGFIAVMMAAFLGIAWRYFRRAQGSEKVSSWLRLLASLTFFLAAFEEGLAAMDVLEWPFLGTVGFSIGNLLMTFAMGIQVSRKAHEVNDLNHELESRIARRSTELLHAKDALITAERGTALGQLAAGVGHEINNPLSYVSGNLDFMRDVIEENEDLEDEHRDEVVAAIAEALEGVERMRKIVKNLSFYARSAASSDNCDLAETIDLVLRVIRPRTRFSMSFDTDVPALPAAALEQSRLVQLLVGLLLQLEEQCATRKQSCDVLIRARQYRTVLHLDFVDRKRSGFLAPLETQLAAPSSASADPRLYLFHTELADVGGKIEVASTDREERVRLFLPISSDQKTSFTEVIGSTTLKANEDYQL